jgi:CHAD domain-containing protein
MTAAASAQADSDSVHDLRTSIRRLCECLKTFDDLFPASEAGRLRRKLRKLMQLAGEVRNRDIAADLFQQAGVATDDAMLERLRTEKVVCQRELKDKIIAWQEDERPKSWRGMLKAK